MSIKKGDKFICTEDLSVLGTLLFIKGQVYTVNYIDNEKVKTLIVLKHDIKDKPQVELEIELITRHFKQI